MKARNSQIMRMVFFMIVFCVFSFPAEAKYGGGMGEPNDPYLIYTAEQMNEIGANHDDFHKHFKLMADIDLSAFTGTDFNIIGTDSYPFYGIFDGNNHTISNFTHTSTNMRSIGLFGCIDDSNAEIRDLGLSDPNVDGGTGEHVGSLVGNLDEGKVTGCYVNGGSITGRERVGGLVGINYRGTITNCYSSTVVSGDVQIGGLVGNNVRGTITCSYATSTVTGDIWVGGLAGHNHNIIAHCYAWGNVEGNSNVGGLVGDNGVFDTIINCYSIGYVLGNNGIGGLVGGYTRGVMDSFWDIQTSGQATSSGGTGKTTAEMQDLNTFMDAGWDFVGKPDGPSDIWAEPADGGYPVLWWQLSTMPPLPTFSGGTGEPNDHYLISTAVELNSIGHNPRLMGAHFKLVDNIDLEGVNFYVISTETFPFTGIFDGNGFMISNFNHTSDTDYTGFFSYVSGPAEIKDLGLIDPNVDGGTGDSVGSLVGHLDARKVTGCYVNGGSIKGKGDVGGLVGSNDSGAITNCYSSAAVSGIWDTGGLVGADYCGTITNCYSLAVVSGDRYTGGLVGSIFISTISNCYVGGGDVFGEMIVGGLVGQSDDSTITACYSTSSVTGAVEAGGLVGEANPPLWMDEVTDSFWDIQTSGQVKNAVGTGLTTAEMQMASTFLDAGWDFIDETANGTEDIWWIDEGQEYPRLWWESLND
jgi:hypothetical protein